jgi:hypothetical protein
MQAILYFSIVRGFSARSAEKPRTGSVSTMLPQAKCGFVTHNIATA